MRLTGRTLSYVLMGDKSVKFELPGYNRKAAGARTSVNKSVNKFDSKLYVEHPQLPRSGKYHESKSCERI